MLLQNAVTRRSLLANVGASTHAGAKHAQAYILQALRFKRFRQRTSSGYLPSQQVDSFIISKSRYIHHSSIRSATPLLNIPEPSPSSEQTPSSSREQFVFQENKSLWHHAVELTQKGDYEMAIALFRSRIKDPLSHIPSPTTRTADELRVSGNFFLALALQAVFHRDNLAGTPEDDELVHVLRQATEGLMRYNHDKGTQATALDMLASHLARRDQPMDAIAIYERHLRVLKEMDKEEPDRTFPSMFGLGLKTPLAHIITALQSLAGAYADIHQPVDAARIMEEACDALQKLEGQGRASPTMHVIASCLRAEFMDASGMSGSSVYAKQAWMKLQQAINLYADQNKCTIEEALEKSDEMATLWEMTSVIFDTSLTDAEWEETYGGRSRKEILTTTKEYGIRMSNMPRNLRVSLPADWDRSFASFYFIPLLHLSSKVGSVGEEIALLEKGVEVLLIQSPMKIPALLTTPNRLPEDLPYSDFISLFDWNTFNFATTTHLIDFLPKLGSARLKLLKQLETDIEDSKSSDAYDTCKNLMSREMEYGLKVMRKHAESAPTQEAKKALEVAKSEFLVLKGRMIARSARQKEEGNEEARQCWEEARNVLSALESDQKKGRAAVEKERLEYLKLAEDLLSRAIEP